MKICKKCGVRETRLNQYSCSVCHNEYQKEYYKKNPNSINKSAKRRRGELINIIIESKDVPCKDCGIKYPTCVMDFDHLRDKRFNISTVSSKFMSIQTLRDEIEKCEVVCSNCHRIRTYKRLNTE